MLSVIKKDLEGITNDVPKGAPEYITRRDFLKRIGAAAAGATAYQVLTPEKSDACIGNRTETSFYEELIKPAISNPELLQTDPDGKVYLRMSVPRELLMQVMNNPSGFKAKIVNSPDVKEPLYETLETALNARTNTQDTHIIEFDRSEKLTGVYDGNGKQLPFSVVRYRSSKDCGPTYKIG